MNKRIFIIGIIIFMVMVGILVIGFNVVKGNNDDEVMNDIRDSYSDIKEDISSYNGVRDDLIEVIDRYYSSNLENDYDKFMECLDKEGELLESIFDEVEELDVLCLDRLFKDKDVNSICSNYKVYYETVFNVYMNDINKVNSFVDSYNEQYNKNLVVYNSSFVKDYIDYDGDGVYLEREDNNE